MIIPSIDIAGGRTVQLVGGRDQALDAGDPFPWLERFGIAGEVAVVDLDAALRRGENRAQITALCRRGRVRVGGGIRDLATARYWLDAGARKIVIGTAAEPTLLRELPRERTIVALDALDGQVVIDGWRAPTGRRVLERIAELRDLVDGFLVTFVEREGRLGGTDLEAARMIVEAAGTARVTIAGGVASAAEVAALDLLGADAQVGMALYTGALDLGTALAAPLRTDRADGLIPTVVVDELGTALGLVYSSAESLARAVAERRGIYHSRQRGIWVKGESSGATQTLLAVDLDCDRDTLRFTVRQQGTGFCHTGRATCWGEAPGLQALLAQLRERREVPVEGSYTQRLWREPGLLSAKLREEADELIAAVSEEEVTQEAADLLYFTLARLAQEAIPFSTITAELARRSLRTARRPGNAKESSPLPPFTGLRRATATSLPERAKRAIDETTLSRARMIVEEVRTGGEPALLARARELDALPAGAQWKFGPDELARARDAIAPDQRQLLERLAERIRSFARAQLGAIAPLDVALPGGRAGHDLVPIERVGCYTPAGRHPLPSSLLMSAVTAKVAGVREVWVVTPRPDPLILAAAAIAGVDGLFAVGGAHAIAALAYGAGAVPACDVIVGPGNRWVTAAKRVVSGDVGIDMLAGPSELVVLADAEADPDLVAADLLAQAEHDPDALPVLVTSSAALLTRVDLALVGQLTTLPGREVAEQGLANGYAVLTTDLAESIQVIDRIAPEHLQLSVGAPAEVARLVRHAGALFLGEGTAEVFGDYGAGPNHILPTGGAARHTAGLSVLTFLRARSWLRMDEGGELLADAAALGRVEGLEGHARAAEGRARRAADSR